MDCPSCGNDNRDEARFCRGCGARLQPVCPSCRAPVGAGQRFCDECGHPLAAAGPAPPQGGARTAEAAAGAAEPVAERRVCSVLFADLVGFTPLSESRDAEAVRELLSGYFDTARTVIDRYGGNVEKFIGDAVMAVWGVPTAHEDDAERSVRAALELVAAVAGYGQAHGAAGLQARAGVVTGEVAVNVGAAGQGMVAGDPVNTASRVQAAAEPGSVLVDETTRQASSRAISYTGAAEHQVKGKATPLRLYRASRVVGTVGGFERVDGLEASFLGREQEFRAVKDAYHATAEQRRARLVSVVGAAGVGKSRLRWEFSKYADGLAGTVLWHAGRCLPYGDGVAYWALAEMVRQRLGIAEEEPTGSAARKLAEGLHRWVSEEADRSFLEPRLGALLGTHDPDLSREDLFAGWRAFFERLADEAPVVLVVEDLQWADAGLLDFLEHLLDWSADAPIFVITFARPELLEHRPGWAAGRRGATALVLDPLPGPVMATLLEELVPGLPVELRDRIVAQADGIPLYAVELVRSLVDRDLVQPVDGVYRLVGQVDALGIPASLASLVAARIDGLPPEQRTLLQGLAVLGGTFPRAAVQAVSDRPAEEVDRQLADLVRREILAVRAERLSPDRGQYAFTQNLLRQIAYDTLSRRDRKSRHLAVAGHLRRTFPDDAAEIAEVVARHYLDAYRAVPDDPDTGQIREAALGTFTRAAQRALSVGAPDAALAAYRQAAELAGEERQRAELTELAGEAAYQGGRTAEAVELFRAAASAHAAAGRQRAAALLNSRLGGALRQLGQGEEGLRLQRAALAVVDSGRPDPDTAQVAARLATAMAISGDQAAAPYVETALVYAQALALPEVLSQALVARGYLLVSQSRHDEALASYLAAAAVADRHGLIREACVAHGNAGYLLLTSDLPGAVEEMEGCLTLTRRRGDRHGEALQQGNLILVHLFAGRWDEAERLASEGLQDPGRPGACYLLIHLPELSARRGQLADARAQLSAAEQPLASTDDVEWLSTLHAAAAVTALADGQPRQALQLAEQAIREGIGLDDLRGEAVRTAWPEAVEAALAIGGLDDADRLVRLVADRLPGHVPPYLQAQLARYRARLAAARGQGDGVAAGFQRATALLGQLGYPYWLAACQLDHAEWAAGQADPATAARLVREAAPVFERLRAAPLLERARELLARLPAAPAATAAGGTG